MKKCYEYFQFEETHNSEMDSISTVGERKKGERSIKQNLPRVDLIALVLVESRKTIK